MKKLIFILSIVILLIANSKSFSQAKNASSEPQGVVEKFLELYFKGEWFEAANACGTEGCPTQIEIMMRKMAMDDVTDDSGKCNFKIDSVKIDQTQKAGKVFFTKICSGVDKPVVNHVDVVKVNNLWYVEYIFKRDKYF